MRTSVLITVLAVSLSVQPAIGQSGWDCKLRSPKGDPRSPNGDATEDFHIRKENNGYYGDGQHTYFKVVSDDEFALVGAKGGYGIVSDSLAEILLVTTLLIDKKTNVARLARTYLKGGPDTNLYGTCIPDP